MSAAVAFVRGPAAAPVVTLDLNPDDNNYVGAEDFTLGAPTFEGDPESLGAEYGYRTCSFTVVVRGPYSVAAARMQAVTRQLLAARNWLMLTPSGSKPMFLRTYRTAQPAVEWSDAGDGVWELPVTLSCDPFLYGEPQTIGPVSIANDPAAAAAANPCFVKLPPILGDAPAPLLARLAPSAGSWAARNLLLSTVALDASQDPAGPVVWQVDALGGRAVDTALVADASMSGGARVTVTSASDPALATRVAGAAPTAPPAGTYRVLVRVQKSDTGSVFTLRLTQELGSPPLGLVRGPTRTYSRGGATAADTATLIDLGLFSFPFGMDHRDVADTAAAGRPLLRFEAGRPSGTGSLHVDYLLLIPVATAASSDVRTMRMQRVGVAAGQTAVLDGDARRFHVATAAGQVVDRPMVPLMGGFPRVTPGATNVVHLVQQHSEPDQIGDGDVITDATQATFTYTPRYLHIRPDVG